MYYFVAITVDMLSGGKDPDADGIHCHLLEAVISISECTSGKFSDLSS